MTIEAAQAQRKIARELARAGFALLAVTLTACSTPAPMPAAITTVLETPASATYPGIGATYWNAERTDYYLYRSSIAEYHYVYPKAPVRGQTFDVDTWDQWPNAVVKDCSDTIYRCVMLDWQAFAVPRAPLKPDDRYVVHGNDFRVVDCVRGFRGVCQVALIRAACYVNAERHGCAPTKAEESHGVSSWILYFIYNEDCGVTSYGIAPMREGEAPKSEAREKAMGYTLAGDNGLLKK